MPTVGGRTLVITRKTSSCGQNLHESGVRRWMSNIISKSTTLDRRSDERSSKLDQGWQVRTEGHGGAGGTRDALVSSCHNCITQVEKVLTHALLVYN